MFAQDKKKRAGAMLAGLQFTLTVAGLPPRTFAVEDFELSEAFSTLFELKVGQR